MSQSLYTKYRPQTFEEVVGQESTKKILTNSITQDKINHAYLFYGIRGTGKTTLARIFAKAVNCTNKASYEPCNECESCKNITSGSSFDVIEIDAASNNGVDEIRDLIEKTNYMTTSSKYKVYIIDEVHMLSKSAFNALLKTLEEPPEGTIFLLATTEINKIPQTILSRSLILNLEILSFDSINKGLKNILDKEAIEYTEDGVTYLNKVSGGSLRDAISALETVIIHSNEVTKETVIKSLGLIDVEEARKLLINDRNALISKLNDIENDPKRTINIILEIVTDLVREGNTEYRGLMTDVLDILVSLKDGSLIKLALISSIVKNLTLTGELKADVPRETITEEPSVEQPMVREEKQPEPLTTEEINLVNEKTEEIRFADDLLKRAELKESLDSEEKIIPEPEITAEEEVTVEKTMEISLPVDEVEESNAIISEANEEDSSDIEIIEETIEINPEVIKETPEPEPKTEEVEVPVVEEEKTEERLIAPEATTEHELDLLIEESSVDENPTQEIDVTTPIEEIPDLNYSLDVTEYINARNYVSVLMDINIDLTERFSDRWKYIPQYQNRPSLKEFISLLDGSQMLSTNGKVVIIGFETKDKYDAFKKISLDKELLAFISELLDKEVVVFPVMPEPWKQLLDLHKKLTIEGKTINEPLRLPNIKIESNEISKLKEVFGDSLEIE